MSDRASRRVEGMRTTARAFLDSGNWSLWLLVGCWYVQTGTFLLTALSDRPDRTTSGSIGVDFVSSSLGDPRAVIFGVLAVATFVAMVPLYFGHGSAQLALFGVGTVGTLLLTADGSWGVGVVPAAMALSAVLTLSTSVLDQLHPRAGTRQP